MGAIQGKWNTSRVMLTEDSMCPGLSGDSDSSFKVQ